MDTNDEKTSLSHFTRGGQTFLHSFRMVNQIINRVLIFGILIFIVSTTVFTYKSTTSYQRYIVFQYGVAKVRSYFDDAAHMTIKDTNQREFSILPKQLLRSKMVQKIVIRFLQNLTIISMCCLLATLICLIIVYKWLARYGKRQTEIRLVRGEQILEPEKLNKLLKKNSKISDISIASLSLPKNFETRHILVHGTTGSGKSVCIRELLLQIRKRGDKAIIYDKGCDYISKFYDQHDILLNPLDKRSAPWTIWDESRDAIDFENIATALIPEAQGTSDPFWINAARTIFSSAAKQLQDNPKRSTSLLLKALVNADLKTLGQFLKGTEAETLMSEKAEKTAISIKSVLITYLKSLQYLRDAPKGFSIRDWINDDRRNNWLFISSLSDRHTILKPLISMWLDIAINSLMSLAPSDQRRVWFILDELSSLQRLPYLAQACAESRKFGGCIVLGLQSIFQLRNVYGNHEAEEISNLCNTRIFFRDPSFESASWASKEIGELELDEKRENFSYSESAMRSGMSISNQRYQRQIISASEIMHLNDLEAYIRIPGKFPVSKLRLKYKAIKFCSKPFMSSY